MNITHLREYPASWSEWKRYACIILHHAGLPWNSQNDNNLDNGHLRKGWQEWGDLSLNENEEDLGSEWDLHGRCLMYEALVRLTDANDSQQESIGVALIQDESHAIEWTWRTDDWQVTVHQNES